MQLGSRVKFSVLILMAVACVITIIIFAPQNTTSAQPSESEMYGRVRAAQVVSAGTETEIYRETYVGIDTDDGKFVQLNIRGPDMRFAPGLHLRILFHPSDDEMSTIDKVDLLKDH